MLADTDLVDLGRYLRRIGLDDATEPGRPASPRPTFETLSALVTAHVRAISFEGLDPYVGIPVADLAPQALQHKMIDRRRGGFCFEQNGLLAAVLESIGYDVVPLAGRVVWMRDPGPMPAETHKLLNVGIPGESSRYIVDVGFGGCTPPNPLRFALDEPQPTDLEEFRIVAVDPTGNHPLDPEVAGQLSMQVRIGDEWRPMYLFTPVPRPPIDSLVGSWFASTYPGSRFVAGATAAIVTESSRLNLAGPQLTEHHRDGRTVKTTLGSVGEILSVLDDRFGIDVDDCPGLAGRLAESLLNG